MDDGSHAPPWFNRWYVMASAGLASLALLGMLFRGVLAVAAQAEAVPALERRFVAESTTQAQTRSAVLSIRSSLSLVIYLQCVQLRKHDADLLPPACSEVASP